MVVHAGGPAVQFEFPGSIARAERQQSGQIDPASRRKLSQSYMDMASKLFTFTFTFTTVEGTPHARGQGHQYPPARAMRQRCRTASAPPLHQHAQRQTWWVR